MENISLFKDVFDKVEAPFIKMKDKELDKIVSVDNIKYETSVPNLERMCYIMESVVLNKKRQGCIYAGFQKQSRAEAIWDRFLKMAENVDKIYIFGEKDIKLKPHKNIEFIDLPKCHSLVKEWFLVMDIKYGKNMMAAYDLDGFGTKPIDLDRHFKGVKTVNTKLVNQSVELLKKII